MGDWQEGGKGEERVGQVVHHDHCEVGSGNFW